MRSTNCSEPTDDRNECAARHSHNYRVDHMRWISVKIKYNFGFLFIKNTICYLLFKNSRSMKRVKSKSVSVTLYREWWPCHSIKSLSSNSLIPTFSTSQWIDHFFLSSFDALFCLIVQRSSLFLCMFAELPK